MQNSPQWVLAFYAHPARRRGRRAGQPDEPHRRAAPLRRRQRRDDGVRRAGPARADAAAARATPGRGLQHLIVATYSDYLTTPTDLRVPDFVAAPRDVPAAPGVIAWADVLRRRPRAGPADRRARRPLRDAVHVGHDRRAQGLHAHAPQRDEHAGRRRAVWFRRTPGLGVPVGAAVLPRHRHVRQHERAAVRRRHGGGAARAGTATSPRRCIQRYRVDHLAVDHRDGGRLPGQPGRSRSTTCRACRSSAAAAPRCPRRWCGA